MQHPPICNVVFRMLYNTNTIGEMVEANQLKLLVVSNYASAVLTNHHIRADVFGRKTVCLCSGDVRLFLNYTIQKQNCMAAECRS